jgi:hypothetical protein
MSQPKVTFSSVIICLIPSLPLPMSSHILCRCFCIMPTMYLMKCQGGYKG